MTLEDTVFIGMHHIEINFNDDMCLYLQVMPGQDEFSLLLPRSCDNRTLRGQFICAYMLYYRWAKVTLWGNDLFVLFECFSLVQSFNLIATHVFWEGK